MGGPLRSSDRVAWQAMMLVSTCCYFALTAKGRNGLFIACAYLSSGGMLLRAHGDNR